MSAKPLSLELVPIESDAQVTPAVESANASGQPPPTLKLVEPAPLSLSIEGASATTSRAEDPIDVEIDVAPVEAPSTDRHRIAATTEFEKGEIDQPLWDRAFAQAKGDRKAALAIYLPARATALRLMKRDTTPPSARPASPRTADPSPSTITRSARENDGGRSRRDNRRAQYKSYGIKAAAVVGAGVVIFAFLTFVYPGSDSSTTSAIASTVSAATQAKSQASAASKAAELKAVEAATRIDATQKLIAKIEEFRATDNWNLLVLYTTEWTRQEPGNAAAWSQLSQGFERLRQFAEAREAATSAVKLAPKEARYWRNLGDLDIELNRQEDALKAFEVAAGLDDKDVHSIVQIGILNIALSRLAEAKAASTRALELSPDDPSALCLKGLIVSSQAPSKVPTAAARQPVSDGACRNTSSSADAAVATVAPTSATTSKPAAVSVKR